jgi:hypothetical protein
MLNTLNPAVNYVCVMTHRDDASVPKNAGRLTYDPRKQRLAPVNRRKLRTNGVCGSHSSLTCR